MLNVNKVITDIETDIRNYYEVEVTLKRTAHAIVCRALGLLDSVTTGEEQLACARALAEVLKIKVIL